MSETSYRPDGQAGGAMARLRYLELLNKHHSDRCDKLEASHAALKDHVHIQLERLREDATQYRMAYNDTLHAKANNSRVDAIERERLAVLESRMDGFKTFQIKVVTATAIITSLVAFFGSAALDFISKLTKVMP